MTIIIIIIIIGSGSKVWEDNKSQASSLESIIKDRATGSLNALLSNGENCFNNPVHHTH